METAKIGETHSPERIAMQSMKLLLPLSLALALMITGVTTSSVNAQGAKMTVGQAGVNPGAGLFVIAEKENLYKKHGLDVNIVKTNTAAAVQAMLGGSMQMATG